MIVGNQFVKLNATSMKVDDQMIQLIALARLETTFPDVLKEFEKFTNHEFTENDIIVLKAMFCNGAIFWNNQIKSGVPFNNGNYN